MIAGAVSREWAASFKFRRIRHRDRRDLQRWTAVQLKRAYEEPRSEDGMRILVDRVWPRGVRKEDLKIDLWLKEAAPSTELRRWFGHEPARWKEFEERYFRELDRNPAAWEPILNAANGRRVTLVYGARDTEHNNAVALARYLEERKSR